MSHQDKICKIIADEDAEAWKTVAYVVAYVDGKVVGK